MLRPMGSARDSLGALPPIPGLSEAWPPAACFPPRQPSTSALRARRTERGPGNFRHQGLAGHHKRPSNWLSLGELHLCRARRRFVRLIVDCQRSTSAHCRTASSTMLPSTSGPLPRAASFRERCARTSILGSTPPAAALNSIRWTDESDRFGSIDCRALLRSPGRSRRVFADGAIGGEDHEPVDERLRDEHPVERVTVQRR